MRVRIIAALVAVCSIGGWVIGSTSVGSAASPRDYERASDFDRAGFWIEGCSGPCPIPLFTGVPFHLRHIGVTYDAVVTTTFTYSTPPGFRATLSTSVRDSEGGSAQVEDVDRFLSPAPKGRSMTLTWHVLSLRGDRSYDLFYSLRSDPSLPDGARISVWNVTSVIEGAPA